MIDNLSKKAASEVCRNCGHDSPHAQQYGDECWCGCVDYDCERWPSEKAAPVLLLYGWTLSREGDAVRTRCSYCGYEFVRGVDDTMREFAETAAQHEC